MSLFAEFIQLNLKKSFLANVELSNYLRDSTGEKICMISEPYRVRGKISSLPKGYNCIASRENARAAIFWRGREIIKVDKLCGNDYAVGIRKINGKNVVLASIYMDINEPAAPRWLQDIIDYCKQKRYPLILSADSNAHSCLLYTSPSPRDLSTSRMPSSA